MNDWRKSRAKEATLARYLLSRLRKKRTNFALSSAEASLCRREAGERGKKESAGGTVGRGKRGSEASSHRPRAIANYRLLLFLLRRRVPTSHVMVIACCVVGGEMNYKPNRQIK